MIERRLVWLAYLALYFAPWLAEKPSAREMAAGLLGGAVFLLVYAYGVRTRRSPWPYALASAAIGFALSPFGGAWSVFNVYGASFAARIKPRGRAAAVVIGLELSLVAFGVLSRHPWLEWASGVFFGGLVGYGAFWQSALEEKNQALEQAQSEVRALATSAERERIARDLHDLLGHTLTVVAIKAELAERLCARDLDAAQREMQELSAIAREALSEVRTAIVGMKGASLALEVERAERALTAAGVDVQVKTQAGAGDPRREAVMTMALREAVTNIIRHAHAKLCSIEVETGADGALRLSVTDDGCGGALVEGSGLTGMRARLLAAGGELRVESGSKGLKIVASLPAAAGARG